MPSLLVLPVGMNIVKSIVFPEVFFFSFSFFSYSDCWLSLFSSTFVMIKERSSIERRERKTRETIWWLFHSCSMNRCLLGLLLLFLFVVVNSIFIAKMCLGETCCCQPSSLLIVFFSSLSCFGLINTEEKRMNVPRQRHSFALSLSLRLSCLPVCR